MKLQPREVKTSLEELLGNASSREVWKNADSLSGSTLERLVIDGEPYVLKHLHVDDDWIMRAQGDLYSRPVLMWMSGLFDALPASLDHTITDVATGLGRNGWGAAILMRDVSPYMVDTASGSIAMEAHLQFLDHMADLHAHFAGFKDPIGLMPMGNRFYMLGWNMANYEIARGNPDPVPRMTPEGWARMADESPTLGKIVIPLVDNGSRLHEALRRGPQTLIHSDWKAGNLGALPDGRTAILDWAFPGEAPGAMDLSWYIAVNCDLIPQTKEESIEVYRDSLERHGVDTRDPSWEAQLELGLLTAIVYMGWSKSGDELAWWEERVPRALRYL